MSRTRTQEGVSCMKKAFTLAEVLITLGIIGVVSALTMPSLVSNHKKQEKITKIKKFYSVMSQNIALSQAEYGDIETWDWNLSLTDFVEKYMLNNLQITKNCKTTNGCWNKSEIIKGLGSNYIENIKGSSFYKLQLSDGTYLAMVKQDNIHVHIYTDINGNKNPDKYGIDCFVMTLTAKEFKDYAHNINKAGIYMFGQGLSRNQLINSSNGGCNKNGHGFFCGALFQQDSWKIQPDYDF